MGRTDRARPAARTARGLATGLGAALLAAAAQGAEPAAAPTSGEIRTTMAEIAAPLQVALPLALSEERFSDPAHRQELAAALAELAKSAAVLEAHGAEREVSFTFMSRSLARDAEEVNRRFREGRPEEARFLLGELAQDCIGCHSRLPSRGDSDLGAALYASVDPADLDPFEKVRLQILTRQFAGALASCEALLASPRFSPPLLDLEGVPDELLLLGVRIERQPERTRTALERFGARDDVPMHLRETLRAWISSLTTLLAEPVDGDGDLLARAERAAAQGQAMRRYPADRRGDVFDLEASSLLHRYLEQKEGELDEPRRAEAYYLLGLTELRRTESFWPSAADFYLEQAIREAPGTDTARASYAVLEEHTIVGYSGSGGVHLPPEIASWLEELRVLAQ